MSVKDDAILLHAMGYAPIPIYPGTKTPGSYDRSTDRWEGLRSWSRIDVTSEFVEEFATWPGVGLGVRLGDAGIMALDAEDPDVCAIIERLAPPTPVAKEGKKGRTYFFRGNIPTQRVNHPREKSRRMMDILGIGSQTVLPPTIHPETQRPYFWSRGYQSLAITAPSDLPEISEEQVREIIVQIATAFGGKALPLASPTRPKVLQSGVEDTVEKPHRALNEHALAHLNQWVPSLGLTKLRPVDRGGYEAVAHWRGSSTGRPMAVRKRNLKIHPDGIVDYGDGPKTYTALDLVMEARTCDLDAAWAWLAEQTSFTASAYLPPLLAPITPVAPPAQPEPVASTILPSEAVLDMPMPDPAEIVDYRALLDRAYGGDFGAISDLDVDPNDIPGLVGDMARAIIATAIKPLPQISIWAAISAVGTLMGRQFVGPTDSMTNLYVVGVAPTGAGKDHPLKFGIDTFLRAGLTTMCLAAAASSSAGWNDMISKYPARAYWIDEIGQTLGEWLNSKCPSHMIGVRKTMLRAWSGRGGWATDHSKTSPAVMMQDTNVSIFGVSTLDALVRAFDGASLSDGLLNRFVIIQEARPGTSIPTRKRQEEVDRIAKRFAEHLKVNAHGDSVAEAQLRRNVTMREITWECDWYESVSTWVERRLEEVESAEGVLSRIREIAIRVATIITWGLDHGQNRVVSKQVADLALRLTVRSMASMAKIVDDTVDAGFDKRQIGSLIKRIKDIIRKNGGWCYQTDLVRGPLRGQNDPAKFLRLIEKDFQDIKSGRDESGRIVWQVVGEEVREEA